MCMLMYVPLLGHKGRASSLKQTIIRINDDVTVNVCYIKESLPALVRDFLHFQVR
jgi:hypothetical protein